MKRHKQFLISSKPLNIDLVSGLIWELDIEGVNELDNAIIVYAKETSGVKKENIESLLLGLVKENLLESFEVEEDFIEEINWNEEWEKKFDLVRISDKIVIKPSFKEYQKNSDEIVLIIDPKMSFGTGEHETTRLVLKLLQDYVKNNFRVLDVGSGTAVLAIAAAKLEAQEVIAVDNDNWCLLNGKENIKRNKVDDRVKVRLGEIQDIKENDFDLILANINKNILLDIKSEITTRLKKGGIVIISGILKSDKEDVLRGYTGEGLHFKHLEQMNEWLALTLRR